ncbi:benzoate/H(+) symporter BenE family transporter [Curvibacter sp. CHRR-16]|uniref:benzoate/H(+) symporter BenE family transporter n=1 Tax=Curvibacter sp. CHRR-16 TaxID=2835872 RepID=UPI001BD9A4DB|nr:benzoate/H(+) symporter BenE family transporter [Curvibacter sp. CHRR-16]MBT0569330.1 benzoate/H(+) symporter BenE family transporter [Curvibacter sp. CHRR-16]
MTTSHTSSFSPSTWHSAVSDVLPAVLAGLIAVLISYAGPLLVVLQAAQKGHLSTGQLSSWVWAISWGAGLSGLWLSWRYRLPVICAWNTPGAALLVTALANMPYSQAIAAYLFAAAGMYVVGVTGWFEKLMAAIPKSLCAAMLAGILLRFGLDVFATASHGTGSTVWLIAAMFVCYLLAKRWSARYAVPLTLVAGVLLYWFNGILGGSLGSSSAAGLQWAQPEWVSPEWSLTSIVSLGLPLLLVGLTGQQVPGIAVLRSAQYTPPTSQLVSFTGLLSVLTAPFGSHGVNLAAITAAICTGPEAHHDARKRWVAGMACGVFYLLLGSVAATLTAWFVLLPHALTATVAGIALLGAIQTGLNNSLSNALNTPAEAEAALITFLVTATNTSLLGIGSACWGLVLGLLAYAVLRKRTTMRACSTGS